MYLNAGIGGWSGIPYAKAIWNMFPDLKDSFTYWSWFTFPEKGALVRPQSSYVRKDGKQQVVGAGEKSNGNANGSANGSVNGNGHAKKDDEEEPPLGEIFCANVFGHYLLTHELMPLLSVHRGRVDGDRGRVVFISTLKPTAQDLPMNDLQGLTSKNPYYGSKRLTDLLGLTAKLPAVRSINSDFWHLKNYTLPPYKYSPTLSSTSTTSSSKPNTICHTTHTEDATTSETETESKPELYVAQPGIVNTSISGMNPLMSLFMVLGFYFARWLGGVWFPISAYPGAVAPVFVGLSEQSKLDELETPPLTSISRSSTGSVSASGSDGEGGSNGESRTSGDFHGWDERDPVQAKVKWGSGTDIWGRERVLKTEVEGWGWSGRVGEVIEPRGRRKGARDLGKEEREDFEGDGRYAWTWMEGVRRAWEGRLGVGDAVR